MNVLIKRIDKTLPLPEYQTEGSAGFDFYARLDTTIEPQSLGLIPGNTIIKTPKGYGLFLASRSSTPKKKGLLTPHGFGLIDQDYCGETDEILIQVYNFGKESVTIEKGERIAQGMFVRIDQANFEEVEKMSDESRGGFGSTGQK
ncbi:dUTP diphosphatase [Candidatus Peregrinibacteria bacterium]|nr:MAG: dUTP diphosphatase [Candidatus Peregrinibacteria bacterium]